MDGGGVENGARVGIGECVPVLKRVVGRELGKELTEG